MFLNFHVEFSFRYYGKMDFVIYHVYVGLDYLVSARSNIVLRHAVYFDRAKGLSEREISSCQRL